MMIVFWREDREEVWTRANIVINSALFAPAFVLVIWVILVLAGHSTRAHTAIFLVLLALSVVIGELARAHSRHCIWKELRDGRPPS